MHSMLVPPGLMCLRMNLHCLSNHSAECLTHRATLQILDLEYRESCRASSSLTHRALKQAELTASVCR